MNITLIPFLPVDYDYLLERRDILSAMNEIPDMSEYASAWLALAEEFRRAGFLDNAAACQKRGEYYNEKGNQMIDNDTESTEIIEIMCQCGNSIDFHDAHGCKRNGCQMTPNQIAFYYVAQVINKGSISTVCPNCSLIFNVK